MELYQQVPESSIDKSWPELDKNPSEEDIQYIKQARNVSKKSPDENFKVLSHIFWFIKCKGWVFAYVLLCRLVLSSYVQR